LCTTPLNVQGGHSDVYAHTVTRMANHQDVPTVKPTTKARGGVTGHNVRYVLAFGLGGVIIAFLIIALYFYGVGF